MKDKKHPIRNTSIAIIVFTIIAFGTSYYFQSQNTVSKRQFEQSHKFLNKRIDTVIDNQEIMKRKIDSIMLVTGKTNLSLDTLKAGQTLIFTEITKVRNNNLKAKNNWADRILNFLD